METISDKYIFKKQLIYSVHLINTTHANVTNYCGYLPFLGKSQIQLSYNIQHIFSLNLKINNKNVVYLFSINPLKFTEYAEVLVFPTHNLIRNNAPN